MAEEDGISEGSVQNTYNCAKGVDADDSAFAFSALKADVQKNVHGR